MLLTTSETLFPLYLSSIHNFLTYLLGKKCFLRLSIGIDPFFLSDAAKEFSTLMKSTFIFQAQMGSFLDDVVAVRKTFPERAFPEGKKERQILCRKARRAKMVFNFSFEFAPRSLEMMMMRCAMAEI